MRFIHRILKPKGSVLNPQFVPQGHRGSHCDSHCIENISFDYISLKKPYPPAYWLLLGDKRIEAYFTADSLAVSLDKKTS